VLNNNLFFRKSRRKKAIDSINITPLVDVMLVLLIIFMVTSPMLVAGVQVELPRTQASTIPGQDNPLSVSVNRNGQIFLNNSEISRGDLVPKLKAITQENYSTRIFVRGDRAAGYGDVVTVIGLLSKSGFSKVSLVTEIDGKN